MQFNHQNLYKGNEPIQFILYYLLVLEELRQIHGFATSSAPLSVRKELHDELQLYSVNAERQKF